MTLAGGPVLLRVRVQGTQDMRHWYWFRKLHQCSLQREQHGEALSVRFQILGQEEFILLLRQGPKCRFTREHESGVYHPMSVSDITRIPSLTLFRCSLGALFDSRIGRSGKPQCRKVLPKRRVERRHLARGLISE